MGYIPHVVIPTFKEGHTPTNTSSKTRLPHNTPGVLSTKVQDQGLTHAPGMGTLEHV